METAEIQQAKDKLSEKITCSLEILTPVHMGHSGGVWYSGIDYMYNDGLIHIIDQDKFLSHFLNEYGSEWIDEFSKNVSNGTADKYLRKENIDWEEFSIFSFEGENPTRELRALMRNGLGKSYIPGSSIKGAIRSVLYNFLYNKLGKPRNIPSNRELLGDFQTAITRYILPFDAIVPTSVVSNISLFNLYGDVGWRSKYKNSDNKPFISAETFAVGAKGQFDIVVMNGFSRLVENTDPKITHIHTHDVIAMQKPVQHLFNIINEYTQEHCKKEIKFFEKYPQASGTQFIIDTLKEMQFLATNNDNSCILRLAYGGGFHAMTGDFRFDDHTETIEYPDSKNTVWSQLERQRVPARYKSRRIVVNAQGYFPMGFVRITLPKNQARIKFQQKNVESLPTKTNQQENITETTAIKIPTVLPKVEAKVISAKTLTKDSVFFAEIIKFGKPFTTVKLLLSDYDFNPEANMTGAKGIELNPGDKVKVKINSQSNDGQIKSVTIFK